ncbi:MAG: hypothetical protein COV44_05825 [Deltaproteobacteria bacterium CG11_big_fil_rev_8_21_14_0_20_45_16]|nr:MAG: hypothetical protein COV44_05825 [Deltaproteobacteria bacterium CG11_big_fil_rev_8_21_14_0_20_45_16]
MNQIISMNIKVLVIGLSGFFVSQPSFAQLSDLSKVNSVWRSGNIDTINRGFEAFYGSNGALNLQNMNNLAKTAPDTSAAANEAFTKPAASYQSTMKRDLKIDLHFGQSANGVETQAYNNILNAHMINQAMQGKSHLRIKREGDLAVHFTTSTSDSAFYKELQSQPAAAVANPIYFDDKTSVADKKRLLKALNEQTGDSMSMTLNSDGSITMKQKVLQSVTYQVSADNFGYSSQSTPSYGEFEKTIPAGSRVTIFNPDLPISLDKASQIVVIDGSGREIVLNSADELTEEQIKTAQGIYMHPSFFPAFIQKTNPAASVGSATTAEQRVRSFWTAGGKKLSSAIRLDDISDLFLGSQPCQQGA